MLTQKAETKTNRLSVENKCVFPGTGKFNFIEADGFARSGKFTFITNIAFFSMASPWFTTTASLFRAFYSSFIKIFTSNNNYRPARKLPATYTAISIAAVTAAIINLGDNAATLQTSITLKPLLT